MDKIRIDLSRTVNIDRLTDLDGTSDRADSPSVTYRRTII